ncbi:MAG: D-alanyl-D-alanine carboxypeptidase [Proteobacteria bacterium]|nr:D-alanyl-D-alanine carboxypeptidase [Pseudomonadota bacterium]MBU1737717.1 D-alanyl-D-alanine carboxypeptidase [Pseudomonadota bacterium]
MRDRCPILYLLLLFLLVSFAVPATVQARSSSKKRRAPVASLSSVHKIQPDSSSPESERDDFPATVADLSTFSRHKTRPDSHGGERLISAVDLRRKISSRSAIVMDGESGQILYSHNPDLAAQPASTIKILTGLIAIQNLDDDEWVPASRKAAAMPSSKINIQRGKSYRADDLINAVLLSSANDASVALAEKIAGSERVFSKLMTYKAKAWGATKTVCKTATGLTARGQKSTARDLAILFNRAMDNPEFAERVARAKIRTGYGKLLRNHNRALWQIDGAEGGKTGFTNAARQTYVGQFKRGDDLLTVAILGSETMWDDIRELVEFGFGRIQSTSASGEQKPEVDRSADISGLMPVKLDSSGPLQILYDAKKVSRL